MPPKDMRVDRFIALNIRLTIKGQEIKRVKWVAEHEFYKDDETGNRVPKRAVQDAWNNSQRDAGFLVAQCNQQLQNEAITLSEWRDQILQMHADQFWRTIYILNGGLDPKHGGFIRSQNLRSSHGVGKDAHFSITEQYVNGLCCQIREGFFGDHLELNDFNQRVKALVNDKLGEFSDWRTEDEWEDE